MNRPPRLQRFLGWVRSVWPGHESYIVRQYKQTFAGNDDVLRDLAEFCSINDDVRSDELERIEGRREVFRHITGLMRLDPLQVHKLLEGEPYE